MDRSVRTPIALVAACVGTLIVAPLAVAAGTSAPALPAASPIVASTLGTPADAGFRLIEHHSTALGAEAGAATFHCGLPAGWTVTVSYAGHGYVATRPDGAASVSCYGVQRPGHPAAELFDAAERLMARQALMTITSARRTGDRLVVVAEKDGQQQFTVLAHGDDSLVESTWRFPAGERAAWQPLLATTDFVGLDEADA